MKILYFSWVREIIGLGGEDFESKSSTVNELIDELKAKNVSYQEAFSDLSLIRVAVEREFIDDYETQIEDSFEIAFFPPMTGG
tara:strand:- start:361 stop:609 length:249 start_codon:yes stop_codon:yes gene_type:complete